jgi:hypothetical protein
MKRKSIPIIAIAVIVLIFAGWKFLRTRDFRYAGTVEATEVDVSARVSSMISTVTVREGDQVILGQTVVELGCEDLRLSADMAARDFARADKLHHSLSEDDLIAFANRHRRYHRRHTGRHIHLGGFDRARITKIASAQKFPAGKNQNDDRNRYDGNTFSFHPFILERIIALHRKLNQYLRTRARGGDFCLKRVEVIGLDIEEIRSPGLVGAIH